MNIYTYDFEVFKYDWLVVFKELTTGERTIFHNDNYGLKKFVTPDKLFCGFNEKHYDCHILKAICCGADNAIVKDINDWIIKEENQGFDHWFVKQNRFWFNHFDIKDDMQMGLSLKAIEGHLGMDIEETEVDFNLDRPLTQDEIDKTIKYCIHDVDTTETLLKLRKDYLKNKLFLGRAKGIPDEKSLYMTNAKLTAMYLDAKAQKHDDERCYKYPDNLKKEYIPQEVFDFFDRMSDPNVSDDELFKSKLEMDLGGCEGVIGFGGIHAAIPNFIFKEGEDVC